MNQQSRTTARTTDRVTDRTMARTRILSRAATAPGGVVRLAGIGSALAPHELPQDVVLAEARRLLAPKFPQFEKLVPAFLNAGVARRHSLAPLDWFSEARDWSERSRIYADGATDLFVRAATAALADAGASAEEVDVIVTVSSTGIATPTLEARAAAQMGFRHDLRRVPVFGLGCAGGVGGLSIARSMAAATPGATVLLVAVEACTLSFTLDRLRKADIIATVLFGDGAAAAVLRSGGGTGAVVHQGVEHTWPDTLDIMGWDVGANGLGVVFDRSIPGFVETQFRDVAVAALRASGLSLTDVDRFVCHPGGAKVLTALETALSLPDGTLDHERAVLRDHGNMSAPTALFVLQRALEAGVNGRLMLCALGPGFTASFLPIDAGPRDA